MSIRSSTHPPDGEDGNVIPLVPARRGRRRTVALAMVLLLVSLATADGMKGDPVENGGAGARQTAGEAPAVRSFVYFPAQDVNQATGPSEHIDAF